MALLTMARARRVASRRRALEEGRPYIDGVEPVDKAALAVKPPPEVSTCIPRLESEAVDFSSADESW